jgi:uncharacterized RDD family membrane protein YckC
MTEQLAPVWQPPARSVGPAPGVEFGDFGPRLVAYLIDGLIVAALTVVGLGYFPWFWSRDGATPGMKMMGLLLVRDADGGPVSGRQAILRLVGYAVSGLVFYLGYVWILIDKRRRGWHDLIAGTVIIKRH